jgi:hypothetical protein
MWDVFPVDEDKARFEAKLGKLAKAKPKQTRG